MVIKKTLPYTAFSTAGTSNAVNAFVLPGDVVLEWVKIKHTTAFSGGSISSYTVSAGITGDLTAFASAFDVFQAVADAAQQFSLCGYVGASVSIKVAAVASHNLNTATAGSVSVWVKYKRAA